MEHHAEGIFLEADTYSALVKTIQRDCRVLESFKIMDYSLLVGIHNLDQAAREKTVSTLARARAYVTGNVTVPCGRVNCVFHVAAGAEVISERGRRSRGSWR